MKTTFGKNDLRRQQYQINFEDFKMDMSDVKRILSSKDAKNKSSEEFGAIKGILAKYNSDPFCQDYVNMLYKIRHAIEIICKYNKLRDTINDIYQASNLFHSMFTENEKFGVRHQMGSTSCDCEMCRTCKTIGICKNAAQGGEDATSSSYSDMSSSDYSSGEEKDAMADYHNNAASAVATTADEQVGSGRRRKRMHRSKNSHVKVKRIIQKRRDNSNTRKRKSKRRHF